VVCRRVGPCPLFLILVKRFCGVSANEVVRWAWDSLESPMSEQGYELVEAEVAQQGSSSILRLYIDKEGGGVTLGDCQAVSHVVRPLMDVASGGISDYLLEVSSPGIDRPVRKPQDFERFTGEKVKIRTHRPIDGRKRFTGVLKSFRDGLVTVECDGALVDIPTDNLHRANLDR